MTLLTSTRSGLLTLTVRRIARLTPNALLIEFAPPLEPVMYRAGQHITLVVRLHDRTLYRSYSLTSNSRLDDCLSIVVQRTAGGAVSNHLNDTVKVGDPLTATAPAGQFWVTADPTLVRHAILIGGGSGITPLYAIARELLFFEPRSRVSLVYSNTTPEEVIYGQALADLERSFPERLGVTHVLEQPSGFPALAGRLTREMLQGLISNLTDGEPSAASYHLCGPVGLLEVAHAALEDSGVSHEQRFTESYVHDPVASPIHANPKTLNMTLWEGGLAHWIEVRAGQTILEAAEAAGVFVPYACRMGECGECRMERRSGVVRSGNNGGLVPSDEGTHVLVCVAHPESEGVALVFP
ncbi:MAG: ferredoxin--NADP reductase [Pleurocapsa sp. SU_196_0]|nr:ferredoxin--NADP reductase [Pleurocapsa sp. SU_196_0]